MTTRAHDDLLTLAKLERERDDLKEANTQARRHVQRVIDACTFGDVAGEQIREAYGAAEDALQWLEDAPAGRKEREVLDDGRIRPRWLRVVPYVAAGVFLAVVWSTTPHDVGWPVTAARAGLGFLGGALVGWWLAVWR